jgi:hypothetical protein
MTKTKAEDQQMEKSADINPSGENADVSNPDQGGGGSPPDNPPDPGNDTPPDSGEGLPAIEEHAKNLQVGAPVFAAVMQAEGWAAGKRIPEAAFTTAVEAFLNAPMGGKQCCQE